MRTVTRCERKEIMKENANDFWHMVETFLSDSWIKHAFFLQGLLLLIQFLFLFLYHNESKKKKREKEIGMKRNNKKKAKKNRKKEPVLKKEE